MKVRIIALFVFSLVVSLLVIALLACTPRQSTKTAGGTRFTAEITGRASSYVLDQFIALLESAGATVLNEGQQPQGMFDNAIRWQLFINDAAVNVYEFSDASARRAISDSISPDGSTLTLTEGDTQVVTHWDYEAYLYFWGYEALLVQYAGQDSTVVDLLSQVLGDPLADGSRLYRQETPGTGIIAGIGEYGVSFQYDPYLAASLEVEVVPGLTAEEASGFTQLVTPDHLVFTFVHTYADQQALYRQAANLDAQPHIAVYPAETYAAMNELAKEQVDSLRSVLADKPLEPGVALPLLPTVNAAQALQARLAHLTFLNGSGVRYLTQVAQEARPVNNQELFYTFQGLTDDGAYYVAAFFPVSTAILPDDAAVADDEAFNAGFADYLAETRTALDGLSPADFTPNLSLLDAVIASLSVEPDPELLGGQALVPATGEPTPLPVIAAPAGLVYSFMDGLWHIGPDGQPQQLLEVTDYRYLLPAPDLAHAVYMDDDSRLWLVNLADDRVRQLDEEVALATE